MRTELPQRVARRSGPDRQRAFARLSARLWPLVLNRLVQTAPVSPDLQFENELLAGLRLAQLLSQIPRRDDCRGT